MATSPPAPPEPTSKCHYCSCGVAGPNNPRINCYAPGCDRAFHLYCYDLGVLCKNILGHSDASNLEAPFLKIACKKECYKKAFRHYANVTADPKTGISPGTGMVVEGMMTQTTRKKHSNCLASTSWQL
jgi:hypothetical protein